MDDRGAAWDDPGVATQRSGWAIDCLLALAILFVSGPIIQVWNAQVASRYTLTVAAVDDASLELDPYVGVLGPDRARFGGHTFSDKAPYQPLMMAPAYWLFRGVGGEPFPVIDDEQLVNRSTHWGLWWLTLWSATIPAIVLTIGVRRLILRFDPALATSVAIAITFGTTVLPFTSWLFGHVLAAMWTVLAWALLRPRDSPRRAHLLAGLCLGAGIGTEYPMALIALLLLADTVLLRRWVGAVWLSMGTAFATVPLLIYNWLVFHNPFEVSYQGHLPNFQGTGALGVFNLTAPQPDEIWRALLGDRGLFVLTPVAFLAAVGCGLAIVRGGDGRRDGWLGLTALVGFLVLSTGIDGLGGDAPGPRYLIPMLPLLAVPLAIVWRRLPVPCSVATLIGGATMWTAMVTAPSIASTSHNALGSWVEHLVRDDLVTNVVTGRDHPWVVVLTTAAGVLALALALRQSAPRAAS